MHSLHIMSNGEDQGTNSLPRFQRNQMHLDAPEPSLSSEAHEEGGFWVGNCINTFLKADINNSRFELSETLLLIKVTLIISISSQPSLCQLVFTSQDWHGSNLQIATCIASSISYVSVGYTV